LIHFYKRVSDSKMPEDISKEFKKKISLKEFEVTNTANSGGEYGNGWDVKEATKKLKIKVISKNERDMEFDMIGYDPSMVNALRRLLLSDVPSMAIEKVHMYQNTSIMQDEVLAHRLGLIPLAADPRLFSWKPEDHEKKKKKAKEGEGDEGTEKDTLEFNLKVRCKNKADKTGYIDDQILTKHIQWVPKGSQATWAGNVGPTEPDILVNKLRPGHEMEIVMFAVKGVGRDHAKFSPVATAFYRLLPAITIKRPIRGEAATRLQSCFSPGVIGLDKGSDGQAVAKVEEARMDSCSRNLYRHEDLKMAVDIEKVKDHFIFTVESVGALPPGTLVGMSSQVMCGVETSCRPWTC